MALILINVLLMMSFSAHAPAAWVRVLSIADGVFLALFLAEAAIKIVALQPRHYFADGWNRLDFVAVAGSALCTAIAPSLSYASQVCPRCSRQCPAAPAPHRRL